MFCGNMFCCCSDVKAFGIDLSCVNVSIFSLLFVLGKVTSLMSKLIDLCL